MRSTPYDAVDAEIALTAFLATTVSAFRIDTPSYTLIKLTAILLLVLTLLRRMAVAHNLDERSRFFQVSTFALDTATTISVLYIPFVAVRWVAVYTGLMSDFPILFGVLTFPLLYSIITVFLVVAVLLGWEVLTTALLTEGGRVIDATADKHRGEVLGVALTEVSKRIQRRRTSVYHFPEQSELDEFITSEPPDFDDVTPERVLHGLLNVLVFLLAVLAVPVIYVILIWTAGALFTTTNLSNALLLGCTLIASGVIRLWYSQYGFVPFEHRNGYLTMVGDATAFFVIVWTVTL